MNQNLLILIVVRKLIDINKLSLPNKRVSLGKNCKNDNSRATTIRQVGVYNYTFYNQVC